MADLAFTPGDAQWDALRNRARTDLWWLAGVVLGLGDAMQMTERAHRLFVTFLARQTGIPEIDTAPYRRVMMPRGMGKTTLGTQVWVLQQVLKNPDTSILLANERLENAVQFLSAIKHWMLQNTLLQALFPDILPSTDKETMWAQDKIKVKGGAGRKEPTIFCIGTGGTVTGMHPDIICCDDILSREAAENARSGQADVTGRINRWIAQLVPLLNHGAQPFPEILFIGCIAKGQRVLMATGEWKPIEDVRPGERVWSWDATQGQFVAQRVTAVIPQGVAPTRELATGSGRQRIRTTPNHPILTTGGPDMRWHRADWFSRFSPVQTLNATPGTAAPWSLEQCWLVGFLMGDGWITTYRKGRRTSYAVCFALGVVEVLNRKAQDALCRWFPNSKAYRTPGRYVRMDSAPAGRTLEALGLTPGVRAPAKTIPDWIKDASPEQKRAFLVGLLDADGYTVPSKVTTYRLSSASRDLVEGARQLAMTCGVRPTSLFSRTRTSHAPNSPEPTISSEYSVAFRFDPTQYEKPLRTSRICHTQEAPPIEVYDLSIEGTENFVCEGFVVHNTRWYAGDSYEFIEQAFGYGQPKRTWLLTQKVEDNDTQTVPVSRIGDLALFQRQALEHGRAIWRERPGYDEESLAKLRLTDPLLFAANYMNDPNDPLTATFKDDWLRYYDWLDQDTLSYIDTSGAKRVKQLADLDILMLVDPGGFKVAKRNDDRARGAILVTGSDKDGRHLLLETWSEPATFLQVGAQIVALATRYQPRRLGIEAVGQQPAFIQVVKDLFTKAGIPCPPIQDLLPRSKDKDQRILGLEGYFQRGQIYISKAARSAEFREQYRTWPRGRRRDVLDALAYGPTMWRNTTGTQTNQRERQEREIAMVRSRMSGTPFQRPI